MGEGAQEPHPTSFFTINSKNVGFSTQNPNLLTFSFNTFVTLVQRFKVISNVSPKLLN